VPMRERIAPPHRSEPFIKVGDRRDLERRTHDTGESPSETALPTE
jgi:hypothetical protein